MLKIQLSFTIFLNKTIFYFLEKHMFHYLVEALAFIINDVFEKSNERTFSCVNWKVNEKKIQQKCLRIMGFGDGSITA